jgi:hypothetical protein
MYEPRGVLNYAQHGPILKDLDRIAEFAGIDKSWIWRSTKDMISQATESWLANMSYHKEKGIFGLCYTGNKSVDREMMSAAGCLVRNYINARFMTVSTVLSYVKENGWVDATVLFIPNFFLSSEASVNIGWKSGVLFDLLLDRKSEGLQTAIYVDSPERMKQVYGTPLHSFIGDTYYVVKGGESCLS